MSLEQVAAGLFNFDPTKSLQAGTDMGNSMINLALESQRQMFDLAGKAASSQLQGERNDISRRSQMFNEMVDGMNRNERFQNERRAEESNYDIGMQYSGGQSEGYYGPGAVDEMPDYSGDSGSDNGAIPPAVTPESTGVSVPEGDLGFSSQVSGGGEYSEPTGEGGMFSADTNQSAQPNQGSDQNFIVAGSRPAQQPVGLALNDKNKVDPSNLYGFMRNEVAGSSLNGMVPKDGAKFGISTGSPEEWATYMVGLAELESSFKTTTTGDVGRFPGNSNGLYQLSPNDATNHGLQDRPFSMEQLRDPEFNARTAVKLHEKLISQDGVIADGSRGAARYWGPLRRGARPQTTKSAQGVLAALNQPVSGGGPDGGLFPAGPQTATNAPPTASPEPASIPVAQPVQQGQPLPQQGIQLSSRFQGDRRAAMTPEQLAVEKARKSYDDTVQEKTQIVTQLSAARRDKLAAEASISALNRSAPNYGQMANIARRAILKEQTRIDALTAQADEVKTREKTLQTAILDAEAAAEISGRRIKTGGTTDHRSLLATYQGADVLERRAMRLELDSEDRIIKEFDFIDGLKEKENPEMSQTYKVGDEDLTFDEVQKFYNPNDPDDPVTKKVNSNPRLKARIMESMGRRYDGGVTVNVSDGIGTVTGGEIPEIEAQSPSNPAQTRRSVLSQEAKSLF